MPFPKIDIIFKTLGSTAIKREERGTVALILEDEVPEENPIILNGINEIPDNLSEENKEQIELAFMGGVKTPKKVIAYVISKGTEQDPTNYTEAQKYLETILWDYLAVPQIKSPDVLPMATWVKGLRDNKDKGVKAVLPHCTADHEGIINLDTDDIKVGGKTYAAAEYCSRIAGIMAGCPLKMSTTFQVLPEVDDVPHMEEEDFSKLIDEGKLVLVNDGEKVKIARGVNSLVTTTKDKGEDFKKITIIDKMDMWKSDVKRTVADNYTGKYPNSYDNKCLLITSVQAYNDELALQGILDDSLPEYNKVFIDIDSQKNYLKSIGTDVEGMEEQDIKKANTKDKVFIASNPKFLDAMEDFKINVSI